MSRLVCMVVSISGQVILVSDDTKDISSVKWVQEPVYVKFLLCDTYFQLKHLNKQKEGKAKLKRIGKVDLPQEAFFSLLGSSGKK